MDYDEDKTVYTTVLKGTVFMDPSFYVEESPGKQTFWADTDVLEPIELSK